jgi:hypothetical protein
MSATVSITHIHLSLVQSVRAAVEGFFEKYAENWTVYIVGGNENSVWVLTVTAPNGRGERERRLSGEDGGHKIENILKTLEEITSELTALRH